MPKNQTHPKIKPAPIHPGDTLGIVAPAGPFDQKLFDQGIDIIRSLGYGVVIPERLRKRDGFLAGSDDHRAAIINDMFGNPGIRGIICARGGYGSMRILDLIDYDIIRNNPKVFIGFSDISALIASIWQRCGLVTFHGPVVTSLGKASQSTKDALIVAISSSEQIEIRTDSPVVIRSGKCAGIVSGGNLATLCHLLGTPDVPDFSGHILVLEDTDEPHYKIDRMLFQMKTAGLFEDVAGVILGSFENCGDPQGIYAIVERIFQDRNIPILAGFDIGHGPVNITIPMGLEAEMITESGFFRYRKPATL